MFGQLTYLLWLLLFIFLPLFALVVWQRRVWRQWRALGLILVGALVGGWAWDALPVQRPVGRVLGSLSKTPGGGMTHDARD